ncbi:type VII secretion target [Actinophytocola oryzae]|uniref:Excreted virulence factor EspC (Type VII ESX diderm) n=1 Tax=Actinophytocola oryzae TaxID=502181 RepID=A0A4R7VJW6_9PSEU|nr:type VII secretion target [Actinophytocola oryzae]TDV49750.1 excreted virulence factor EspC (type VII ESX diderm) [Actinophytocola oryzae]
MADEFEVSVDGLREHAATVGSLAGEVSAVGTAAQVAVGGDSFGSIAQFFAQSIMSTSDEMRAAIGTSAQSVMDVQSGLTATANAYQQTEEHHAQVFRVADGSATVAAAATGEVGQRDKAIAVLERISREHPVSVATVAVRQVKWFRGWVGNVLASRIGDHYEKDIPDLLAREPTDANIRAVADRETAFWNSEKDGNWLGAAVSADRRYNMLVDARTDWLNEMPPAQRDQVARQLGVRLGD